jgi:hypothetical protein
MAIVAEERVVKVREFSPEEGRQIFDEAARFYLDMSGEEFLVAWRAGTFRNDPDHPGVMDVALLLDLAQPD